MRINIRVFDVICLAGLVALAALGSLAAGKIAIARVKSTERKNLAIKAHLEELNKAKGVLGRLNSAIQANEAALTQLRTRLPESQAMGHFLSDLDTLMERSGVDLSKVAPGSPVAETLCRRTPLSFSCRGAFPDLHTVLYGLETQERVIRVDQVSITGEGESGECSMDVTCSVYGR